MHKYSQKIKTTLHKSWIQWEISLKKALTVLSKSHLFIKDNTPNNTAYSTHLKKIIKWYIEIYFINTYDGYEKVLINVFCVIYFYLWGNPLIDGMVTLKMIYNEENWTQTYGDLNEPF